MINTLDDLVIQILNFCDHRGIDPLRSSRDQFRKYHPEGRRKIVTQMWTVARLRASRQWSKKQKELVAIDRDPVDAVPQTHSLKGVSTLIRLPGGGLQWQKTRKEYEDREAAMFRLLTELPGKVTAVSTTKPPNIARGEDLISVYPMGDPHIGMLAWGREVGESWDLKIAEQINNRAIESLVSRGDKTKTALLINLGDFFHSDTPHATTTKGTRLDVDGRWSRTLEIGMRTIAYTIDQLLLHHTRVIVDCQIGNHDEHSSIMLAIGLRERYRNEPRLTVDVDPNPYHYHRFDNVLIGTCHGDGAKIQDLPGIMASDSEHWSACKYRHWLTGHVHHTQVKEFPGCTVESFRTLATKDAWHHKSGYRSRRDMQKIIFHRKHGEMSRVFFNPDMPV